MHRKVRFSLRFGGIDDGNILNSFDEGVEFSFRNLNSSRREWIPLMFFTSVDPNNRNERINIGGISAGRVQIRGYSVLYNSTIANNASRPLDVTLSICGSEIVQNNGTFNHIQFRWLQTVTQTANPNRDRVLLDDVEIIYSYLIEKHRIFMDDFNNQTTLE